MTKCFQKEDLERKITKRTPHQAFIKTETIKVFYFQPIQNAAAIYSSWALNPSTPQVHMIKTGKYI